MDSKKVQRYGWIPDIPDKRDEKFTFAALVAPTQIPIHVRVDEIDLAPFFPPIYDQLILGGCTGNGMAALDDYTRKNQGFDFLNPSRLYYYANARKLEGCFPTDSGAMIRDVIKGAAAFGAPPESLWPYDISKFNIEWPTNVATIAGKNIVKQYSSIDNTKLDQILDCLDAQRPIIMGFSVYESFESQTVAKSGIVPMPNFNTEKMVGGHCVVIVGRSISKKQFKCRNSWGENWGDKGYFYIPFDYFTDGNLADDFWIVEWISS